MTVYTILGDLHIYGFSIMLNATGSFKYLVTKCALELPLLVDSDVTLEVTRDIKCLVTHCFATQCALK